MLMGPTRQLHESDPTCLPPRELPHGNISNLFLLYLAYTRTAKGVIEIASRATFYQVAKHWLQTCLRFHKKTSHAVCLTCSKLKAKLRACSDFATHAKIADELLGHYTLMWRDREVYWKSRERSQTHMDQLSVVVDSYDKAKIMLPRWPANRLPKKSLYEVIRRALALN